VLDPGTKSTPTAIAPLCRDVHGPLLAMVFVLTAFVMGAPPAAASALEPCEAGVPPGEVVYAGALVQAPFSKSARKLRRSGIRQEPIRPATGIAGEQELPVSSVTWKGSRIAVRLNGGLRLVRGGRTLSIKRLRIVMAPDPPRRIIGRVGSREVRLFTLRKTRLRTKKGRVSEIELSGGSMRLTAAAARLLRNRLGVRGFSRGMAWARPDLFVEGAGGSDLVGSLPSPAPEVTDPPGAVPLKSASIEWRIRESFVKYLSSGGSVTPVQPAAPGPPEPIGGGVELVYRFDIPVNSGWTDGGSGDAAVLLRGSGGVRFRLCRNTINFTLTAPELLLDGDQSRLVVRASGTDGTAFDGRRVSVLRLFPSRAKSTVISGSETRIEGIPAFIAEGAEGVFISYPAFPGSFDDPDRVALSSFGSVTVTYTRGAAG